MSQNSSQATMERPAATPTSDMPAFPPILSLYQQLPEQSDPKVVSTSTKRLALYADSDEDSKNAYVGDQAGVAAPGLTAFLETYWDGKPASDYTLTMRQYWRMVPGTYTLVQPGGSFTRSYQVTTGISTTDTDTLSAELGISGDGLSASVSASFSHSVTTSEETIVKTTVSAGAPPDGSQRVWVLWQLVDEIVALDPSGNVLVANQGRKGNVAWNGQGRQSNGAFLSYKNVQQAFPSDIYMAQQQDFVNPK